ncbi:Pol protein [Phytophthora palmivora]|uniref:Pol protein n=1 Tax=Phytophthora palmivora TaxID=4796 RepID=A0A2P4YN66_9STRA|nr:Pol protein [Phytophthora palmivora]
MDRGEFPHLTDSQFESVRKMVGIFGGDALRSLAAATPAEQVERIEAFNTYERGLIAHVQGLLAPVAEMKPAQPKPLGLKVNTYEGKEGENLHFWVRGVELAMDAAQISTERLRVAFALSNLGGRAKTWAAAFLPANYEYRQRSRFLACKQGKRELHEYIQEMRVLAASLVGNPLPERIKVTVFMDCLKVDPSRTQLFRVHTNTMEEAIQIALQEEYSYRQARTPTSVWQRHNASSGAVQGALAAGASTEPTVARNGDKYADALRESEGRGQVSVGLADGTVVNVPGVRMDLAVMFEDFDSTESFLVLDMDKYDLILGMPWLSPGSIGAAKPLGLAGLQSPTELCVGNEVPRGIKKTCTGAEVWWSTSRLDNQVPHSESETPPARPIEEQCHVFDGVSGRQVRAGAVHLEALPEVSALLNLEELSMMDFLAELKAGEIAEMVLLKSETSLEDLNSSSILKNPEDLVYPLVKEYSDVVSKHPPSQLPPDRGVRHEFDLVSGTKYCVTRQWPLPREQCEVIDVFFAEKAKSGIVRESKSPHLTPTFCTPIPRKGMLQNNMSGCTLYSALDLVDGYYQILMRESDIPLTAVSTRSRKLWEWLVMSQGLSNATATFNRLVTQLFRPLRTFAQTYLDDIFVHSRADDSQTDLEVHRKHLRRMFEVGRATKLYANIDKCVFAAEEINVLGCFVSRVGVRADPGKVKAIAAWPTPRSQKDPRK